jgi:uncharacterized membrane protein (DUF485 family)
MPIDKLVLLLVLVVAAAGFTVWTGTLVADRHSMPGGWMIAVPVLLVGYVVWRMVADRPRPPGKRRDDRKDR